ncbi:EAL domain-containing protein [Aestuariibacter halophilus]|uniref:EAL domain-containing protein n=1 Tax=Fluctibacter halophilus TaxID=226011 RepID=A0ABS8GCC8_9ALTE|nr:EAL domain-containing protein [Aestuariibacter halophilus]MCC2618224.1 EAL domain-containing protein [Aestuariibacter halophilus]
MHHFSVISSLFSASIAICLMTLLMVALTHRIKQDDAPYYSLLLLCLSTAAYQACTWQYHLSTSEAEALYWLRGQISAAIIGLGAYGWGFAQWSRQAFPRVWLTAICVVSGVLLLANMFAQYPLRFASITGFVPAQISEGGKFALLSGEPGSWNYLYHGFGVFILIWSLWRIQSFFRRRNYLLSFGLLMFVILQLSGSVIAVAIDAGQVHSVYLSGFPMAFLLLFVGVAFALRLTHQTYYLRRQIVRRQQIEGALSALAKGVSSQSEGNYYRQLLDNLLSLFSMRMGMIGLLDPSGQSVTTTLAIDNGETLENFTYSLNNTPCENTLASDICLYTDHVAEVFPDDQALQHMGMQAYVGVPLQDAGQKPVGLLVLLHDAPIKPREEHLKVLHVFASRASAELARDKVEANLRDAAFTDALTRLPNRLGFLHQLSARLEGSDEPQLPAILMLFNIDGFRDINRIYGHDIAELVLLEVNHRLREYAIDGYLLGRTGGDEFAVLIVHTSPHPAPLIPLHWEALSVKLGAPILLGNRHITLQTSMGAVVLPDMAESASEALRHAESALRQAKQAGKQQYRVYDPVLQKSQDRKEYLERLLQQALRDDQQLKLFFQPQLNANNECVGAEVLLRWDHPEEGPISPAEFVPVAEKSGLINGVGQWLFRAIIVQLRTWIDQGEQLPPQCSVNVSALQLADEGFVSHLLALLNRYELPEGLLVLEITESGFVEDMQQAIEKLHQLRNQGLRIALDDFGTGYSSLSYIRQLPLDEIKVDKSFVDQLDDPTNRGLIESILAIGRHMSLDVVLEGVESKQQLRQLIALGCHRFQGYYFSKPLPASAFLAFIKQHSDKKAPLT